MTSPQAIEKLKHLFGSNNTVFINHLNLAVNGGQIFKDSNANYYLDSLRNQSPQLANCIQEGLKYPNLEQILSDLIKELDYLINAHQKDKPTKFKKVMDILDSAKKISDTVKEVAPYTKTLYSLAKTFIELKTGFSLPDWQ